MTSLVLQDAQYYDWWDNFNETYPLSSTQRITVCRTPLTSVDDKQQQEEVERLGYFKPVGLWYGISKEWVDWCVGESCVSFLGNYIYSLEIDTSNMLVLSTPEDLDEFTERYNNPKLLHCYYRSMAIDWGLVAEHYSGIEIAPYQYSRRMADHTAWYYGWDVASGCIWKGNAVKNISLLETCPIDQTKRRKEDEAVQAQCSG